MPASLREHRQQAAGPVATSSITSTIALIPVTLSERGFRAIEGARVPGLTRDILDHSMPVHSRMVHKRDKSGGLTETAVPYSPKGECIFITQRTTIGKCLMLALRKEPNVKVFFGHKLVACDLNAKTAAFECIARPRSQDITNLGLAEGMTADNPHAEGASSKRTTGFDFIIGADGAHSLLRQQIMRQSNMDYQQSYTDALWCDFYMPPDSDGHHRLDPAYLHLWPHKECVFIVSPDVNGSSRGGMVAPVAEFRRLIQHPEELETFFSHRYPGVVPNLMSVEAVKEQFLHREHLSLVSIRCGQFGFGDSCVLLGDSSHTMVPFYAMGMNTGLEDVRIFFEEFIDPAHRGASYNTFCPASVNQAYTEYRRPDVQAMTDIAAEHFDELKTGVPSKSSIPRKFFEWNLQKHAPALDFIPFYSRVVFGHERFLVVKRKDRYQKVLFNVFLSSLCLVGLLAMTVYAID
ncbi:MAG: hypothetical protein Q9201_000584 [Fulgogasparrea decipioides]